MLGVRFGIQMDFGGSIKDIGLHLLVYLCTDSFIWEGTCIMYHDAFRAVIVFHTLKSAPNVLPFVSFL